MVSPDIRYTQCSGDDSSMESKCDCPRQSVFFDSLRGAPPCNVAIITCVDKTEPPPICHPDRVKRAEGSAQVACFTLRRLLLQLEWIPPLRLRYGRNDNAFCIGCYKFKCTTYMAAGCRRYIAWYHSPPQVVFGTWRAASRPNWRSTIHPHRLYSKRGGRQVAAPTFNAPRFLHFTNAKPASNV